MHVAKFLRSPMLLVVAWLAIGVLWSGPYLLSYLERPQGPYLLVATAYLLWGISMAIACFVIAPANASRFTRRQVVAAKVLPVVPLAIAIFAVLQR